MQKVFHICARVEKLPKKRAYIEQHIVFKRFYSLLSSLCIEYTETIGSVQCAHIVAAGGAGRLCLHRALGQTGQKPQSSIKDSVCSEKEIIVTGLCNKKGYLYGAVTTYKELYNVQKY